MDACRKNLQGRKVFFAKRLEGGVLNRSNQLTKSDEDLILFAFEQLLINFNNIFLDGGRQKGVRVYDRFDELKGRIKIRKQQSGEI